MASATRTALDLHPKVAAGGAAYLAVIGALGAIQGLLSDKNNRLPAVVSFALAALGSALPIVAAYLKTGD